MDSLGLKDQLRSFKLKIFFLILIGHLKLRHEKAPTK